MATRPSQENSPISIPTSHPPFSSVPPEKVLLLLPIGRPFTGTHRPTIYRAFPNFISFHLISLLFCSLSSSGVNRHSYVPRSALRHPLTSGSQCNYSSTQHPDTVYKGVSPFSHIFPSKLMMKPWGFYLIINEGIWSPVLAERPHVFPIR